jgi:NAD(P)-dependent dehydrogenase (short-subunit alcohol dehydrogenase family)
MRTNYLLKKSDAPASRRLAERIILITGAAGGIGEAVCLACAREGATLVLLDKNQRGIDQLYDRIVAADYPTPVQVREELTTLDEGRAEALAEQIDSTFARLDGIIHLAQESAPLSPLEHFPTAIWGRLLYAQVSAPWILTRTLLPLLRRSDAPRIIFSSGAAGRAPQAYHGATAIAWSAVDNLAGIMADEFRANEKIRVFSVDPGAVHTPMRIRWYPGDDPSTLPSSASVADAWVFLASAESTGFDTTLCTVRYGMLEAG